MKKTILMFIMGGIAMTGEYLSSTSTDIDYRVATKHFFTGGCIAAGGLWVRRPGRNSMLEPVDVRDLPKDKEPVDTK